MLTGAFNDIHKQVDKLKKSWADKNPDCFYTAVHTLKSVTAIVGLNSLQKYCSQIDTKFASRTFNNEAYELYNQITESWFVASVELNEIIKQY